MKKIFYIYSIVLLISVIIFSCKDKEVMNPDNPNEEELITTVKLVMTDASNNSIVREAKWFDDPASTTITIDTIRLDANKAYNVTVYLLDESKNPVDTISNEVEEEAEDHQLFYIFKDVSNVLSDNLAIDYIPADKDSYGVPIGLYPKFTTTGTINGKLTVVLKHQPGIKPKSGNGDINIGASDVEVVFPVKIQ